MIVTSNHSCAIYAKLATVMRKTLQKYCSVVRNQYARIALTELLLAISNVLIVSSMELIVATISS